ncbi:methyltransferase domain-containing protein [Gulosibacter macacae]|uniref:Methyltransferase domain-containing protein n=1 Tax=Gulosibacter macacae TaxID=2488791 RepID=A0A3P3W3T8_9MICO|nr:class I SAM-dependent methyltransferase [Gulosibacter macacae]RRJ88586.1 methyltransferase domain-containing protein [Gulosibacter macacae]
MSELEKSRRFVDEQVVETAEQLIARRFALESGLPTISPTLGAHLAFVAAASGAERIIEIGSTGGLTTTWLQRGAPTATITCIDAESEYLADTRQALIAAGHAPARIRCITGDPLAVLPRMSENSYDLVLVAADLAHAAAHLTHALRIVRAGGSIVALNALNGGRVADPARRDPVTASLRALVREFQRQPDLVASVLPIDGGLLQITAVAH